MPNNNNHAAKFSFEICHYYGVVIRVSNIQRLYRLNLLSSKAACQSLQFLYQNTIELFIVLMKSFVYFKYES